MERANRPPPLNLTPPHSRQSSVSKTISAKGRSPTTTISLNEDDWSTGRWTTLLRVFGDFAHILVCMIAILIMGVFLNYDETMVNSPMGMLAVFLMVLLGLDILLDFQSIGRYDKMWKGWALASRVVVAVGYTSVFAAQVAMGGAFPEGYTYWGLTPEYSAPLVYVFLWVLGIWDLVYCGISRKQFIREAKRYREALLGSSGPKTQSRLNTMRGWDVEATTHPRPAVMRR